MKRSVLLNSTSAQGKKLQKSFTDVNPEATGQSLKTFAQKVNALTTATYNSTDMVDKYNLDTENPPGQLPTPTLSLPSTSYSGVSVKYEAITYSGDGELYVEAYDLNNLISAQVILQNNVPKLYLTKIGSTTQTETYTYKLKSTATDNYNAAEFTFTVAP